MTQTSIVILGINGHIGHHAARAFVDAGYMVSGFGRNNRNPVAGVKFIKGDAERLEDVTAAVAAAEIVFNALNLPYDEWDKGRAEAQLATVIAAMGNSGKTLLYPGNIYNYAATDRHISPGTLQQPHTPRGAIRVRQETMLAKASAEGKFQTIILRAGDFFAAGNTADWFDQAMLLDVKKGKIHHMADLDFGHAWAYLPDLGGAFVALADRRAQFMSFETFHFSGHYVTHGALMAAIEAAWPTPLKVTPFPWIVFQALALGHGMLREIVKMRYLWNNPMELVDPRLDAILGPSFGTKFEVAIAETVQPFTQRHALRQNR